MLEAVRTFFVRNVTGFVGTRSDPRGLLCIFDTLCT